MAKKTSFFHDTKPPVRVPKPLMTENGKNAKTGEVCTECWAWGSVFGLLGVGRFCTCD